MKTIVDQSLRDEIKSFYGDPSNIDVLFRIHPIQIGVSIRLIHFYFNKYCSYNYPEVHADWESEFKKHKKTRFDFYARGEEKILMMNQNDIVIESTWSQLNFFKWCITTKHFFPCEPDLVQKIIEAHKLWRVLKSSKGISRSVSILEDNQECFQLDHKKISVDNKAKRKRSPVHAEKEPLKVSSAFLHGEDDCKRKTLFPSTNIQCANDDIGTLKIQCWQVENESRMRMI